MGDAHPFFCVTRNRWVNLSVESRIGKGATCRQNHPSYGSYPQGQRPALILTLVGELSIRHRPGPEGHGECHREQRSRRRMRACTHLSCDSEISRTMGEPVGGSSNWERK